MIEINEIFSDSDKRVAIWSESIMDRNDLAIMCENIVNNHVDLVSVAPEMVMDTWTYLEKSGVKIFTRYEFSTTQKNIDKDMSALSENITKSNKHGANGVQIFVKMRDFERLIDMLQIVRDDLFFEKDLCIVMDIQDLPMNNLNFVFEKLKAARTNVLALTLNEDMGNRSDFVGRIYGLLQQYNLDQGPHFILGNNFDRIDQVVRLTEILRPELSDKLKFFLDY